MQSRGWMAIRIIAQLNSARRKGWCGLCGVLVVEWCVVDCQTQDNKKKKGVGVTTKGVYTGIMIGWSDCDIGLLYLVILSWWVVVDKEEMWCYCFSDFIIVLSSNVVCCWMEMFVWIGASRKEEMINKLTTPRVPACNTTLSWGFALRFHNFIIIIILMLILFITGETWGRLNVFGPAY